MLPGIFATSSNHGSASIFAPSAIATAHGFANAGHAQSASTADRQEFRPSVFVGMRLWSAQMGARKTSLLHISVGSSIHKAALESDLLKLHPEWSRAAVRPPMKHSVAQMESDGRCVRERLAPISTAMVAGITRSSPYFARSSGEVIDPVQQRNDRSDCIGIREALRAHRQVAWPSP